jgi:hypothetical protein
MMSAVKVRIPLLSRLRIAWCALCGWGIISGVSIRDGEVDMTSTRRLLFSGRARITNCHILTSGPVTFVGKGTTYGNYGSAITPEQERL